MTRNNQYKEKSRSGVRGIGMFEFRSAKQFSTRNEGATGIVAEILDASNDKGLDRRKAVPRAGAMDFLRFGRIERPRGCRGYCNFAHQEYCNHASKSLGAIDRFKHCWALLGLQQ